MICVLAALKSEIEPFLQRLGGLRSWKTHGLALYEGETGGRRVRVVKTGIGKKNIGPETVAGCTLLVSTGFCGALVPGIAAGDIVLSTATGSAASTSREGEGPPAPVTGGSSAAFLPAGCPDSLAAFAERAAGECSVAMRRGPTVTADRIVRTPAEKAKLHEETGAIAVDMEDFHRLGLARAAGLPFVSLRVVLDELGERIPGVADPFRLPGDLARLLMKTGPCGRSLAAFLVRFFEKFEMECN